MTLKKFDLTPEKKKAGLAHVLYEIERLVGAAGTLGHIQDQTSAQAQVLFEVLLLHVRALLEFFERVERSKDWKNGVENADILSSDYEFGSRKVHLDSTFRQRLNKELAHLSYDRTCDEWEMGALLVPLLNRCLEFTETVVSGPLHSMIDDPKQLERWTQVHDVLRGWPEPPAP